MPFNQQIILKIPAVILGVVVIGSAVILSVAGVLIVRRHIPHHKLKIHNDVAGPIFATLGVVYAVLLAFVVVIVWEDFDRSRSHIQHEANCLVGLYRDAEGFSPDFKNQVRGLLNNYAETVVNEEWKTMARGELSPAVGAIMRNMWLVYSNYVPRTEGEKTFFDESVRKLNDLSELRGSRLMDAKTGVHPLLWFVLIVGGTVTIMFTFLFGAENLSAQLAMTTLLAVLISLILFTILAMDFPFTGGVSISPEPFTQIRANW